jgi:hypothetical protein
MTRTLLTILSVSLPIIVLTGCLASPKQTAPKGTPPVTQQESEKQKALDRRSLAPFTILEGTPYKLGAVVESEGKDRGFLSGSSSSSSYKGDSYGYSKQFNYIFLNTQTKESVKLLPKSDYLFTRLEKIGKKNEKGEFTKVDAIWYEVVKSGQKNSDDRPKKTIATSTVSGTNYTELIPQVDRILNTFQPSATKILMVYELNKKYFIAELDLTDRKVIETKELPNLE